MGTPHRITLSVAKRTGESTTYNAYWRGELLATGRNVEHAACRELQTRGESGEVEFWWEGAEHACMRGGVAWFAAHTVVEGNNSPRFAEFVPFKSDVFESQPVESLESL